jgi:fructose-bisphosphate aldolase, class II
MTLVRTQELLDTAVNSRVGVAAFNVITLEHAAITAGAEAAAAPAILQVSQNAVKFHGGAVRPLAAALQEIARATSVDLALHLDHVEDIRLLHQAADSGFSASSCLARPCGSLGDVRRINAWLCSQHRGDR